MTVMTKPQQSFRLEPVHPKPEEAHTMPYAPAVHIVGACDLMFLSGATPSPLYHKHPHVDAEHVHPHSIEEQTDRAMVAIKSILDHVGASWRDVVKVTKYLTDFREADAMHKTMHKYFGDWRPASTTVCINSAVVARRAHRARHDRGAAEESHVTLPPHLAPHRRSRISAFLGRGNGAPARGDRSAAGRSRAAIIWFSAAPIASVRPCNG